MSAFGQLYATHTQILVPPGTAMLLESFWNRESPQGQPTSDVPLTPCCGFVFQRLGRLRLLWRVNDRNNNKQRTSEMAGLMCYMWKVPGVCPLKTVWILCREQARHLSRQLALGKLCCCSHGEWHRVSNKTLEHVLNFKTMSCPDDPLARCAGVGVPTHPSFVHIPSFPMWKSCPWGGFWVGVVFAQISVSAAHPILATNPLVQCSHCALLEVHKQQCHPLVGGCRGPSCTCGACLAIQGDFPNTGSPTETPCCSEAASEASGQPPWARCSCSLMLINIKSFASEVWMWISALAVVRHLLNRGLSVPWQHTQT